MSIDKTPSLNYFHNQVFLTTRNVVNFSFSALKNDPNHKVVVRSLTKAILTRKVIETLGPEHLGKSINKRKNEKQLVLSGYPNK